MLTAIGIPIVDAVPGECFADIMKVFAECHRPLPWDVPWNETGDRGNSTYLITPLNTFPHDRARGTIHQAADEAKADLLFYIDSDMLLPPDAFQRMLRTLIDTEAAVVSGYYYRRGMDYTPVWYRVIKEPTETEKGEYQPVLVPDGIHEIHSSGLGCALINLHWVRSHLKPPFYTMGVTEMHSEITDDVSFFQKVRAAGGRIIGDANVRCGHLAARIPVCDLTFKAMHQMAVDAMKCVGSETKP